MTINTDHQDKIARFTQMTSFLFQHRRMTEAMDRILEEHACRQRQTEAGFLALIGESRSGKSTIKELLLKELNKDRRRAVALTLTQKVEPKGILELYLQALGDLTPRGTVTQLLPKAQQATIAEGVEIVFIDEAQHLRREDAKVSFARADAAKVLLDVACVPFIFIGTPDLDGLLGTNNQAQFRMFDRLEITPFSTSVPEDWQEFRALLLNYDRALPFSEWCFLHSKRVALALHAASQGYVGRLMRLARHAGRQAIRQSCARIEVEHWARAWEALEAPYAQASVANPFNGLALPPPEPKPADDLPSAA